MTLEVGASGAFTVWLTAPVDDLDLEVKENEEEEEKGWLTWPV